MSIISPKPYPPVPEDSYPTIEISVGDTIIIHRKPRVWSSAVKDTVGWDVVTYPYELVVKKCLAKDGGYSFTEGKYGWWYKEGFPMTKVNKPSNKKIEIGSAKKVDPIIIVGYKSNPTLVYGTPTPKFTISAHKTRPSLIGLNPDDTPKLISTGIKGFNAEDTLVMYDKTGNVVVNSSTEKPSSYFILNEGIDLTFGKLGNGLPEEFTPYISQIREVFMTQGCLRFTELDNAENGAYGIAFIKAGRLEQELIESLSDAGYETLGWYVPKVLSHVLGLSEQAIERLQKDDASHLGELVSKKENGIRKLANTILYFERYNLTEFVGCHFDWKDNRAWSFKFDGENYFAYFTW